MAEVDCNTRCTLRHPLSKKRRNACKKKRDCVCTVCSPFKSLNLNLYEGCQDACNGSNPPQSKCNYLKDYVGLEFAFTSYQVIDCGFQPETDSFQGQQAQKEEEEFDKKEDQKSNFLNYVVIGGALGIIVLLVILIRK